jgi:hypothetical protein
MMIFPFLMPMVFVAFAIALIVVVYFYRKKKERERTEEMKAAAALVGWNFSPTAPLNHIPWLEQFPLFSHGHGKEIRNFIYGQALDVKAAVFDYVYTVGSGKNQQTYMQSVVYLEPRDLTLPLFSLRPEGTWYKIISALGYQDIDFGQRPEFSRQYLLRGQDEPAIRRTFNDRLLAFFEGYPGLSLDAGGSQMFLFSGNYQFPGSEIQQYVGLALNILQLLPRY